MNITLKQLEVFYTAARELNLARAAKIMEMTPPAVTKHVKNLEAICEVKLFGITGRQVYLTEAGQKLFDNIQPILTEATVLQGVIRSLSHTDLEPVTISLTDTCRMLYLTAIKSFKDANPNIQLHIESFSSLRALQESIDTRPKDVYLCGEVPDINKVEYQCEQTATFKLVLVAHKNNPICKSKSPIKEIPNQLCAYMDVQTQSGQHQKRYWKLWGASNTIEVASHGSAYDIVRQNLGLAILPDILVQHDLDNGEFVALDAPIEALTFPINVVNHRTRSLHANAQKFVEHIKQFKL